MQDIPAACMFNRTAIMPDETGGSETTGVHFLQGEQPFLKVNLKGKRFCNESGPYDFMLHSMLYQPKSTYCTIWDSSYAEDIARFDMVGCSRLGEYPNGAPSNTTLERAVEAWEKLIEDGYVIKADSLDELADGLDIPADTFVETVEKYNSFEEKQYDEDYGKVPYRLSRLDEPPYYGVRTTGAFLCTLDGILIDVNMNALDEDKEPIQGLYVSGNDSGGLFANTYPNLATGIAAGRSLTFGRIAAQKIAEQ